MTTHDKIDLPKIGLQVSYVLLSHYLQIRTRFLKLSGDLSN